MRLYWKMLLLATMMFPLLNPLVSATGAHDLENGLLLYADRPDLPNHHVFEQSLRLSLMASIATRLDCYNEFSDVSRFPGPALGASSMYRRDS
jgi:hypothetical protein